MDAPQTVIREDDGAGFNWPRRLPWRILPNKQGEVLFLPSKILRRCQGVKGGFLRLVLNKYSK